MYKILWRLTYQNEPRGSNESCNRSQSSKARNKTYDWSRRHGKLYFERYLVKQKFFLSECYVLWILGI